MADNTLPASDAAGTGQLVANQGAIQQTANSGIIPQQNPLASLNGQVQPETGKAHHAQTLLPSQQNAEFFGEGIMSSPLSSMIVPAILGVLIFFSVITWAILLIKGLQFTRFRRQNKQFIRQFWASPTLVEGQKVATQIESSLARLACVGIDVICGNDITAHRRELAQQINRAERLERSLRRQIQHERRTLENGLAIVASIGSTAPFIGLFGTVWGIMEALIRIGATGEAGLNSVAGPIGHALIATGVGIAAAVPAVLVYNYFVRRFKLATGDMEAFAEEFYSLAQETSFSANQHKDGDGI